MRLDIADRLRLDAGDRLRLGDHLGLAVDAGRGVADLGAPSLLIAEPLITAWMCRRRRARRPAASAPRCPTPLPKTVPCALGVEGAAVPVGREDPALLVEVAASLRHADRDAAGQRHVALAVQQALAGQVDRHQRGRAGGLHGDARPAQLSL